jgi:hypothetical protein
MYHCQAEVRKVSSCQARHPPGHRPSAHGRPNIFITAKTNVCESTFIDFYASSGENGLGRRKLDSEYGYAIVGTNLFREQPISALMAEAESN